MDWLLLPGELWRRVFELYFAGSGTMDDDGERAREAMDLAVVCRTWTVRSSPFFTAAAIE
jgi:hypothetical protein